MECVEVHVTCPTCEEARHIARVVVEERLAACAQVSEAKVTSFFYWENKLEADTEATLVMKTPAALFLPLEREVRRLHSDDVPQIVAVPIVAGNEGYLKWMVETTTPPDSSKAE